MKTTKKFPKNRYHIYPMAVLCVSGTRLYVSDYNFHDFTVSDKRHALCLSLSDARIVKRFIQSISDYRIVISPVGYSRVYKGFYE